VGDYNKMVDDDDIELMNTEELGGGSMLDDEGLTLEDPSKDMLEEEDNDLDGGSVGGKDLQTLVI